ncbi:MAG: hypothetical protein ABSC47_05130 [Terracidiphilus sp.]|jgi:hypothetical protein
MRSLLRFALTSGFVLASLLSGSILCSRAVSAAPEQKHIPCCGPVTPAGDRLAAALDSMNVESLWLAGDHVNWETGEPDRGAEYEGPGNHSHCSAFAAAAAKRLGVYLLRPPEHGQLLLANAQADWLAGDAGAQAGWRRVSDMREAQRLANQGNLVLALYQNPDRNVPGHIAVVRPSEKTSKALVENGLEMIQAGQRNYTKVSARFGFQNHPGAWPDGIRYYSHTVK